MQLLDLNLSRRPYKNNSLVWGGCLAAVVLLVAYTVWNVATYRKHRSLLEQLSAEVSSIDTQRQDLQLRQHAAVAGIERYDLDILAVQAGKANEILAWRAFSWTRLFNLLEEFQPWEVRMNSIRPMFRGTAAGASDEANRPAGSVPVVVEGTAKTYQAFTEFETVLQQKTHFGRVEPGRLKRLETGEILFDLQFLYYPEMALEAAQANAVAEPEPEAGSGADPRGAPDPEEPPPSGPADASALEAVRPGAVGAASSGEGGS